MARIEKTVFISYRRSDVYTALAVYQDLKNKGYDVFFDYRSVSSGDFEQIITSNIKARAHFLLILTPTALDRLNEPGDWLRREIETAIDEKRNVVPLFFKGFRFGSPSPSDTLTGKLKNLSRYNGLNVHEDYFDEAMHRLRTEFLNKPLDTVLHPVSTEVQKVVRAEQVAADKALEQIEDVKELVKQADEMPNLEPAGSVFVESPTGRDREERKIEKPARESVSPVSPAKPSQRKRSTGAGASPRAFPDLKGIPSKFNISTGSMHRLRFLGLVVGAVLVIIALVLAVKSNLFAPKLGIGSAMISDKDGMTLLYVPAGEFTMGSDDGSSDEQPVHTVALNAFWIDQTEVTNAMYAKCVNARACNWPTSTSSWTRDSYYGNSEFDNYPVIYVSWNDAKAYCEWADRRLPTEAEWEKAARGENAFNYPWGDSAPNNDLLNYNSAVGDTTEVGKYPEGASPYGALDMAGNVWEWVADWYSNTYYTSSLTSNPSGPDSGQSRALRGGNWRDYEGNRSADRYWSDPTGTNLYLGFRCALSENGPVQSAPLAQAVTDTPSSGQTSQPVKTSTPSLPTETSTPPTPTLGVGSTMTGKDGMTLVYVPAGKFTMGDAAEVGFSECQKYRSDCNLADFTDESPPHEIDLQAYWIDQTEVTNGMYALCVKDGVCQSPMRSDSNSHSSYYGNPDFDKYPVIYVDWTMANEYCAWAGRRLPTEAEWEKAARGNDARMYPWGNNLPDSNLANLNGELGDTTAVRSYETGKSPYGAYDMAGNVWEWVADWYGETYYTSNPSIDPLGPGSGQWRVYRGGSWYNNPDVIRSAIRGAKPPETSENGIGFRCAISADEAIQSSADQPATTPALDIGSTTTGKDGMTVLYVPAGEFIMGSDSGVSNEAPIHIVYLDAFWIDQTEVTNKMYSLCKEVGICREPTNTSSYTHTSYYGNSEYDNYPVIYVDWSMARTYCEWAGRRLPTEAEWEKAARGTDQRVYPWGGTIDQTYANYNGFVGDTTKVGIYEKGKSFYGTFDMAGNVWEWVNDRYSETYYSSFDPGSASLNPLGPDLGEERVLRGGSWGNVNNSVRSANRTQSEPIHRDGYAGFRCAKSAAP